MDKVYAWMPKAKESNIGHASLDIAFGQGFGKSEYVSWWPGDLSLFKPGHSNVFTYPDDVDSEGGQPDRMVEIRCLDSDRMREKWLSLKKTSGYSFLYKNCAEMVVQILVAGGAGLAYDVFMEMSTVKIWAPWDVVNIAQTINSNASIIEAQRKDGWTPEKPGIIKMWLSSISVTGVSGP